MKGLTQEQLAEAMGVSIAAVSKVGNQRLRAGADDAGGSGDVLRNVGGDALGKMAAESNSALPKQIWNEIQNG